MTISKNFRPVLSSFLTGHARAPIGTLSMMNDINSAKDIDLIITIDTQFAVVMWVSTWNSVYGTPIIASILGLQAPVYSPYLNTGQVISLIPSNRGGAEYEKLVNAPWFGTAMLDTQSATHALVLVLVVISNVPILIKKFTGGVK